MKNLKIMSMLLGGLLALGSITACSSNDDEPEIMKPTGAKVEYVVNLSQDLLNAATVTIYYGRRPSHSPHCLQRQDSVCSPC